jgi:hypothetical protein
MGSVPYVLCILRTGDVESGLQFSDSNWRWRLPQRRETISLYTWSFEEGKTSMKYFSVRVAAIAFTLAGAGLRAQGPTTPPINPGLWEIHSEREVNGQKVADPSERFKNMPPEKRAQIEAMMKQHGVSPNAGGGGQVCYTKETLAKSPWDNQESDCKAVFSSRSGSSWKWHTSCPKSGYESDGEAAFTDREHYTVTASSVAKVGEIARNSRTTITAKWLSSDCGGLKPIDTKP